LQGDSGGRPLVYYNRDIKKGWVLVGIVSWGEGWAAAGFPVIYARVSEFIPWIKKNIAEDAALHVTTTKAPKKPGCKKC